MENKIITFLHSGDAGDIIAGLATVKEICEKENAKAILFLDTTGGTSCNDDDLNNLVLVQTKGKGLKFNDKVADFIIPVIKIQPYIISVEKWNPSLEIKIDYNLNIFREKFIDIDVIKKTNQNLMFLHQCAVGLDFGYKGPWLSCDDFDNSEKHKIVIGRSSRCQSAHAFFSIYEDILKKDAEFIGTDFEYELQIAQTNRVLSGEQLDTMFFTTSLEYSYLSSSSVKEIAAFGGDISMCVPTFVADLVYEKYGVNDKGNKERRYEQQD